MRMARAVQGKARATKLDDKTPGYAGRFAVEKESSRCDMPLPGYARLSGIL